MHQPECTAGALGGTLRGEHLPEAGTVDMSNFLEVENQPAAALGDAGANGFSEKAGAFAKMDSADQTKDEDRAVF